MKELNGGMKHWNDEREHKKLLREEIIKLKYEALKREQEQKTSCYTKKSN